MRTILNVAVLCLAMSGCVTMQETKTSADQPSPTVQNIREDLTEISNLVVIGSVIGSKSLLVEQALKQEDIFCIIEGNEFHEISVPKHLQQKATEILRRDSKQKQYRIIWETP
ncbi:hypothetical protein P3T73_13085 [Kiritimatiellota bacterium B12222]|nr:hypothetical protein P3T73_13085 [Kiritimatiellota bacterium B12222]